MSIKWSAFGDHSSYLNHGYLCDPLNNPNNNKGGIAEEISEHIEFSFFNFPGVDLIEKLEENENLEHECEVSNLLCLVTELEVIWCVS